LNESQKIYLYEIKNSVNVSRQERKIWMCKSCEIYFEPKPPEYHCPQCKGNTTVPAKDFDKEKHVLWEPEKLELIPCSKCGELMASGYVVEKNFPLDLSTIGEGIYWTPDEWGSLG
jgi:uncharacterized UBP type Zn finger protein